MSATSQPTLDMLPSMRDVAAVIAKDAREADVISVGPLYADQVSGGTQYSVVVIVPERGGKDFSPSFVMLDVAQDSFMAAVYRTEPIVRWKSFLVACRFLATN